MSLPFISIIIPIFNAEKYLRKCLDSVVSQTLRNIEIILVDDGSPDNSGKICEEYAKKDKRIRAIHQQNQGVSIARQIGLDNATGEYIIHVDADDWIESFAMECLYEKAKIEHADMVISDYWVENSTQNSVLTKQSFENQTSHQIMLRMINQELFGSCWNKLIKKSVIDKYHIKFQPPHITYCEDLLFNSRLLSHDIRVSHLNKAIYHYCTYNQQNLSNSLSTNRLDSRIFVNQELEKLIYENERECLFNQKKDVLKEAFLLKRFDVIKKHYHDIQAQIIKEKQPTDYYLITFLCMAFQGHPYIAYYLYKIRRMATIFGHHILKSK